MINWLARFDPSASFGPIDPLEAVIAALALIVRADLAIPELDNNDARHPAWPAVLTLLATAIRGDTDALEHRLDARSPGAS